MSTPQLPLKPVLTEEQVNRIWKNITSPLREPGRRHWLGRPLFLVTTCLALATVLFLVLVGFERVQPGSGSLPLDTGAIPSLGATFEHATFQDGSVLTASKGGGFQLLQNSGEQVVVQQRLGAVRYSITPGGRRKWLINAELASIEVVGTVFNVERRKDGVLVHVERGSISVRTAQWTRRLTAGETLSIPPNPIATPVDEMTSPPIPFGPSYEHEAPSSVAMAPAAPRERKLKVSEQDMYRAREPRPDSETVSVLLSKVEQLLSQGNDDQARSELKNALGSMKRDATWSVVALRLSLLLSNMPATREEALSYLASIIEVGEPLSVVEDASALRIDLLRKQGHGPQADAEFEAFLAKWPNSVWLK